MPVGVTSTCAKYYLLLGFNIKKLPKSTIFGLYSYDKSGKFDNGFQLIN
jgi:hypothetical protein